MFLQFIIVKCLDIIYKALNHKKSFLFDCEIMLVIRLVIF